MKNALWIGAIGVLWAGAVLAGGRPDLVAKVRAGRIKQAKASWWGFDPEDSTAILQAAIDSHVPKLIVDNPGKPWITRPLFAVSNQEILFEKGVVIEAKRGEFKGGNDSLFTIKEKHDVTLRGYGATLRMHREDYANPKLYSKAEWRMVLNILSSKNINVYGLTLALSGGDGIYLGVSKPGVPPENVLIKDVICDRNYRQGISVISARHLRIENTIMRDTAGTPPAAGIDFEPNGPSEELVDCVMRNCVSERNHGCGYAFYLPNLHADSAPISIRLENCISRGGNSTDLAFTTGNTVEKAVHGDFTAVGCRFEHSRGVAIAINDKPVGGVRMQFRHCVIDSPAKDKPNLPPISIMTRAGARRSIGDIDFGDLLVIDPVDRPFLDFYDWLGGAGALSIRGTVTLRHGDRQQVIRITPEWMKKHFPPRNLVHIPPLSMAGKRLAPAVPNAAPAHRPSRFFLRNSGTLVFEARKGQPVSFTVRYAQVGHYAGRPLAPELTTPAGKTVRLPAVPFQKTATIRFQARADGLYRLRLEPGANRIGILAASCPFAVSGETGEIHFIGPAGDLYFLVPAGARRFGVLLHGEGRAEGVRATIFDPSGKQVWAKKCIILPEMFAPKRTPPRRDEVWRIRLQAPAGVTCEDNYLDLRGIPPFVSPDPRGLLKPVP